MTVNKSFFYIIIFTLLLIGTTFYALTHFATSNYGPNPIPDPIQRSITAKTISHTTQKGDINITFLAKYNISAQVKSKKSYISDAASIISPVDLALVWGTLNQPIHSKSIKYSQRHRWYYYRVTEDIALDTTYISEHSANTHIIPGNETVASLIKTVGKNDYITLEGYLCSVHFEQSDWSSSLSRTDTGNGACEIMFVETIIIH